jgi:hypothetical protein
MLFNALALGQMNAAIRALNHVLIERLDGFLMIHTAAVLAQQVQDQPDRQAQ